MNTSIDAIGVADKLQFDQNTYKKDLIHIIGWLLTILFPISIYHYMPSIALHGMDEPKIFLCILSSAAAMWIFSLLPEFIPGIFVLLATLLSSLVETNIILSGFASPTFIIVLSIMVMTLALRQSGIIERILSYFFKRTSSVNCVSWILFTFGIIITPILPSIISRSQLLGPIIFKISKSINLKQDNDKRNLLFINGFFGITLLASSFISASLLNFIIFSLLPLQEQQQFQSKGWFTATLVVTGILLATYLLIFFLFFSRKSNTKKIPYNFSSSNKQESISKMKAHELLPLLFLLMFFVGMLTTSYHHISNSWMAFVFLFVIFVTGFVKNEDFQQHIDWPYLMFLSSIVGIASISKALALDTWLYENLLKLFPSILQDKTLVFALITTVVLILRLILPVGAVVVLLIPTVLTISTKIGLSAWTLCFVLLFVGDIWFFPYQCSFYQTYLSYFNKSLINENKLLKLNASFNLIKLLALFLSLYYWKYLSLI